jgi:threonylcarbamoyladenosine tRNA methylthiotransferase MtaB
MRIHLQSLGCRLNEAELETWSREFQTHGHQITRKLDDADVVIVNTCAVTAEAVKKSRKLMHRAHHSNPQAKLVISGCYASLDPTQNSQSLGVDLVVPNTEKERLVETAIQKLNLVAMPELATQPGENSLLARGRQRAFIKVQDGCRYQCTFCIVTVARGEERSRPIEEVVQEINALHDEGINEAVLTGVHIGGYGSDSGSSLEELVRQVLKQTRIPRLRLGAVEPWDIPDSFWELFKNPRFMPHLHLPLQSGSDEILRRMARRCKRSEFEALVTKARQQVPDFNLTTDIIVGFPGESDAQWQQTLEMVERIGFGHLHIFAYSQRPGTRAATLSDMVPRAVIRQRSQELHELGERLKLNNLKTYIGRSFPVLIEGSGGPDGKSLSGYTPNFLRVGISNLDPSAENTIQQIRIEGLSSSGEMLQGVPDKASRKAGIR